GKRIRPIRMRRADIDVRFGRHAGMADGVGADEAAQRVLAGDPIGIAEVLDQLEAMADGQDLRALDVLDEIRESAQVAVKVDTEAEGVFRRHVLLEDLRTEFGETPLDLAAALLHLAVNFESLRHFVLLGDFEAYDELLAVRLAVERVAGRVRSAVLQRLQHRGHLTAHVPGSATMNQSGNSTHDPFSSEPPAGLPPSGQIVPILLKIPVCLSGHELFPLVALVVR